MKRASSYRGTMVWWAGAASILLACSGAAWADFTFGEPVNLGPVVNSEQEDYTHCVSADGLELYYMYNGIWDPNAPGWDISVSTRPTEEDDWGPPTNLGPVVNSLKDDMGPCISFDGLELYFQSNRPGGAGLDDIWVSRRATKDDPWGAPENLGPPVNTETWDYNPRISADGLELYFAYGLDPRLAVTRRETKDAPWGEPEDLGPVVNSWTCQDGPWVSSDGLVLIFSDFWGCDPRPDGLGGTDIWLSRRASKDDDWTTPVNIGTPVNTEFADDAPMISADGSMLYFNSDRPGGSGHMDIWQAPIIPIVDFNADGKVDLVDLVMLVDDWGTSTSLCDIGPMPWGDGKVDIDDLKVFMTYYEKENPPVKP
jgi:hypothetical protein